MIFKTLFWIVFLLNVVDDIQTYIGVVVQGKSEKNRFIERLMTRYGKHKGFWIMAAVELVGFIASWILGTSGLILVSGIACAVLVIVGVVLIGVIVNNFEEMR